MKRIVFISLLIFILSFLVMNTCKSESFANSDTDQIMWDGKLSTIKKVIEDLKKEWSLCGFDNLDLQAKDFSIINSRKRLIELLPVTKMIQKLDYQKIKCYLNKFDPENYVIISKTITNVPKVLKPLNIIIVNNMLYQSTPYGVLKYQMPKLSHLNTNTALNASIESGVINNYNIFNTSNNTIFNLEGKLLQNYDNKILDLKNNDEYIFTNVNNKIELNKKSSVQVVNTTKDFKVLAKEKMSNIEDMVDIGGIINVNTLKKIDSKTFLPVVKIQANQKLADIKKAAEDEAKKKAIEIVIMKTIEMAEKEIIKTKDILNSNPNDPKAKKAVEDATKKLIDAKKVATEIVQKEVDKKSLENIANKLVELAEKEVKKAKDIATINPNDSKAKKDLEEAEKKLIDAKKVAKVDVKVPVINDINLNEILKDLVSVIEYDGILYVCHQTIVKPLSSWAIKLNELINKNKFKLITVIPHYYYLNDKFNYVLIFVFNDDFCAILNKETLSDILDVKAALGISFNQNIPDRFSCDDMKVILEQMTKAKVLNDDKSKSLLKRYKC